MNSQDFRNLQESYLNVYELDEAGTPLPVGKMDAKAKELKSKFLKSKPGSPEAGKLISRASQIIGTRDSKVVSDSYDLYDIILSHLLDEGYADTPEQAEVIMVNMSEDWRESICEGLKPLPVSKMSKQARRIAFSHGTDVNSDEGSSGNVPHSNAARALAKMARFGGKEVKSHIKKGYERGSRYDPYYQELNSRNPSRNKEV